MNKTENIFLLIVAILVFVGASFLAIPLFESSEKNLEKTPSEVFLNSNELVANFVSDTEKASVLYVGKVVEVTGFVEEVTFLNNRKTVLLYTENTASGIICDVNENQTEKINTLQKHQKITVKGICKGFLKDVILLNCYIDLKPNE